MSVLVVGGHHVHTYTVCIIISSPLIPEEFMVFHEANIKCHQYA